ncbi:MAG: hypothetical protein HGB29_07410 [Chlorobiaceae bacterium]|nr:hypothetical protein [Chlorobiaceae bacterium]NTW74674.1 hypothetical protein [Chlorobiaceae bacterium]
MAKAKKEETNSKPRPRISFLKALFILLGADIVLLFAPGLGILNSVFYIGEVISWSALVIGVVLLVAGFRGLFGKR